MRDPFGGRGKWLVAAAIVGLGLTFGFGLFSDDPSSIVTPRANAFSRSVVGHHALVAFLEKMGLPVQVSRYQTGTKLVPGAALLVASPDTDGEDLDRAIALVSQARGDGIPTVVVLPKWVVTSRDPDRRGWAGGVGWWEPEAITASLDALLEEDGIAPPLRYGGAVRGSFQGLSGGGTLAPELPAAQLLGDGGPFEAVLHREEGILIAKLQGEPLWIVSDPDLVNNGGLGLGDNAATIHRLLVEAVGARAVIVDETHHGFEQVPSIFREMARFPLALVSLHLMVLLGAVVWAAGIRFGRPKPAPPRVTPGMGALIDNTARLVHQAGDPGDTLYRYFRLTVRHAARLCALPPNLELAEQIRRLDRLGRSRGVSHSLEDLAQQVREIPPVAQRYRYALDRCRDLAAWRKEITDGFR